MDVGAPSNFERLRHLLGTDELRRLVRGERVDAATTYATMRRVYEETGYLADPHTAVGLEAARRRREAGVVGVIVVLSTAHPAKFDDIVRKAVGCAPTMPAALAALLGGKTEVQPIARDYAAFRRYMLASSAA
jgi:threonine synthase